MGGRAGHHGRSAAHMLTAGLGLAFLLVAAAPAVASTLTWTGGSNNNWSEATNWDVNQAPQTGDDLVLTLDGFPPSNNDLAGVQLHSVTLSAATSLLSSYTVGGNAIVLQGGGSIISNHSAGTNHDNIDAGVTLNGPATITLAGTQVLNVNGAITGTGGLTLANNSGTHNQLRLAGINSYTGTTTVAGTHRIHAFFDGSLPNGGAVVISSAGISFNTSSTIGSLAGTGVVTETGAIGVTTLTVGGDNTSTTYMGVLVDGTLKVALTKAGTGTLTLSGANTYTGATTVNAGTLLVTGSLAAGSAVTVANGGTLGGTGTIGGTVTAQLGGRLAPGTSIGTLTVGGPVTWHGSTTVTPTALFELSNSDTTSDRLAITAALTRGTGSGFVFDFLGTGNEGVYTLATFASTTFTAGNFSYVNLAPGLVGTFSIVGGNTLRFTVSEAPPATHDFNGDLKADILWRDTAGGLVAVWLMNGVNLLGSPIITTLATTWAVAGVGDFNGDGDADILWRENDGDLAVWLLNGTTIATNGPIFPVVTSWTVAGLGDFNGDGRTDILWLNTASGQVAIWLMNGVAPIATVVIGTVPTTSVVAGVGDFDGDGLADILWREADGDLSVWLMNGTTVVTTVPLASVPTVWLVVGVGDFNGDGVADILWRNTSTGQVALWLVNGTTPGTTSIASTHVIATVALTWAIALVQDFDGDGHADILWRENDGTVAIWLMNGPALVTSAVLGDVPLNWVPR